MEHQGAFTPYLKSSCPFSSASMMNSSLSHLTDMYVWMSRNYGRPPEKITWALMAYTILVHGNQGFINHMYRKSQGEYILLNFVVRLLSTKRYSKGWTISPIDWRLLFSLLCLLSISMKGICRSLCPVVPQFIIKNSTNVCFSVQNVRTTEKTSHLSYWHTIARLVPCMESKRAYIKLRLWK